MTTSTSTAGPQTPPTAAPPAVRLPKAIAGVGFIASPVSDEVVDWAWSLAMQAGLHPTLECAKAFGHTDFRQDLAAFRVPTLVVHGTSDKTVPIDATGRAAAKQAYEAARRAILRCQKDGYKLPAEKYNRWKTTIIDFNPGGGARIN